MAFTEVARTGDLDDGAMKMVLMKDRDILLARVGDRYYAAENRCPHMGGNLSGGTLTGTVVTCPRHHSQFDLTDGRMVGWTDWTGIKLTVAKLARHPRPLQTYEVKIENDRILVGGESILAPVG
jgi:3-phenylpropionate/trans-cinnamate dioxygenase ferredoxin subunit